MKHVEHNCLLMISIFLLICRSLANPGQEGNKALSSALTTHALAPRRVQVVTELHLWQKAISLRSQEPVYGGHAQIWVDGTDTDGPLIIELGISPMAQPSHEQKYAVRSKDLGVANTGKAIRPYPYPGSLRFTLMEGMTTLTNAVMFDHQTGKGLIADAWMEDPVYRIGTGSRPNTCYDLLVLVLERMELEVDPVTKRLFANSTEYYTLYSMRMVQRVQDVASITTEPAGDQDKIEARVFDVDFEYNPHAPSLIFDKIDYRPRSQTLLTAANGLH
ncbi:MAG: hypothetical protein Q9222_000805 [Ikaeria aurantiellina]